MCEAGLVTMSWYIRLSCKTIGNAHNVSSRWTAFKEQTVIKVLTARLIFPFSVELQFSDHTHGIWHGEQYLSTHAGPLLDRLRDPVYFVRFFVDAGALCWPNGLELSPVRLQALVEITAAA